MERTTAEVGLELHPDKTRLIEFGRFAATNRKERGKGKPETFNFLGSRTFVDRPGRTANSSCCARPCRKRLLAKLKAGQGGNFRGLMHQPLAEVGKWLRSVVQGLLQLSCCSSNIASLRNFRFEVSKLWLRVIRRRSQRSRITRELMDQFVAQLAPFAQNPSSISPFALRR